MDSLSGLLGPKCRESAKTVRFSIHSALMSRFFPGGSST